MKEVAGETETKYDTIFKCKKLQEDAMFELEVINFPTEHIYNPENLYVLENFLDDIINNYFNQEVNDF